MPSRPCSAVSARCRSTTDHDRPRRRAACRARSARASCTWPATSNTVRTSVVTGTARRTAQWAAGSRRGWCTRARLDGRSEPARPRLTSTVAPSNPGRPQSAAAVVWEATAPGPASSTAAITRWSSSGAAPARRSTRLVTATSIPERRRRRTLGAATPAARSCRRATNECWPRAMARMAASEPARSTAPRCQPAVTPSPPPALLVRRSHPIRARSADQNGYLPSLPAARSSAMAQPKAMR